MSLIWIKYEITVMNITMNEPSEMWLFNIFGFMLSLWTIMQISEKDFV